MAPSAIAEKPEASDFTGVSPAIEILPLAGRFQQSAAAGKAVPVRVQNLFDSALIEKNRMSRGSKAADVVISVLLHVTILTVPIMASLYFTDTINLKQFTATFLVAPPPPPPPPPVAAAVVKTVAPRRVFMSQGKLLAPKYIPEKVAEIKEAPIQDSALDGVAGGVPGGVPGGQMGGVIGGVIGGLGSTPIAPISKPKAPIRVGGRIRAPKAIVQTPPVYPVIAKQAHISGVVVIDAVLDEQGNVIEMKVVSGPPLLYAAALEALKQWKYEPTYLNDQAIPVQMIVNITFQLSDNH